MPPRPQLHRVKIHLDVKAARDAEEVEAASVLKLQQRATNSSFSALTVIPASSSGKRSRAKQSHMKAINRATHSPPLPRSPMVSSSSHSSVRADFTPTT